VYHFWSSTVKLPSNSCGTRSVAAASALDKQVDSCAMSANLVAGSNGALDTLGNGTGTGNGTVNGIKSEPIDRLQHDAEIEDEADDTPEVDIHISNVVCNFSTRCHLNLRTIATNGLNVEYRREQGVSRSLFLIAF
jgi:hypothetical protein